MATPTLYHIIFEADWLQVKDNAFYSPPSLEAEGFIHYSTGEQVTGTANFIFADALDLLVLEIDPTLVGHDVIFEDLYEAGQEFPHIYAPLPLNAVTNVHRLTRTADTQFLFTV